MEYERNGYEDAIRNMNEIHGAQKQQRASLLLLSSIQLPVGIPGKVPAPTGLATDRGGRVVFIRETGPSVRGNARGQRGSARE